MSPDNSRISKSTTFRLAKHTCTLIILAFTATLAFADASFAQTFQHRLSAGGLHFGSLEQRPGSARGHRNAPTGYQSRPRVAQRANVATAAVDIRQEYIPMIDGCAENSKFVRSVISSSGTETDGKTPRIQANIKSKFGSLSYWEFITDMGEPINIIALNMKSRIHYWCSDWWKQKIALDMNLTKMEDGLIVTRNVCGSGSGFICRDVILYKIGKNGKIEKHIVNIDYQLYRDIFTIFEFVIQDIECSGIKCNILGYVRIYYSTNLFSNGEEQADGARLVSKDKINYDVFDSFARDSTEIFSNRPSSRALFYDTVRQFFNKYRKSGDFYYSDFLQASE